jgi:hypothetical protein
VLWPVGADVDAEVGFAGHLADLEVAQGHREDKKELGQVGKENYCYSTVRVHLQNATQIEGIVSVLFHTSYIIYIYILYIHF